MPTDAERRCPDSLSTRGGSRTAPAGIFRKEQPNPASNVAPEAAQRLGLDDALPLHLQVDQLGAQPLVGPPAHPLRLRRPPHPVRVRPAERGEDAPRAGLVARAPVLAGDRVA